MLADQLPEPGRLEREVFGDLWPHERHRRQCRYSEGRSATRAIAIRRSGSETRAAAAAGSRARAASVIGTIARERRSRGRRGTRAARGFPAPAPRLADARDDRGDRAGASVGVASARARSRSSRARCRAALHVRIARSDASIAGSVRYIVTPSQIVSVGRASDRGRRPPARRAARRAGAPRSPT